MNNEPGKIYDRPWGSYQTLALENGYQVKILNILPGGRLSLQKHMRRSEHWVVVKGTPTVTVGKVKQIYEPDRSVCIPKNVLHRIENFTNALCVLVEVQIGEYLGEDDIVRVEDVYKRG